MQVTVFGASGHIGQLVVTKLLADSHQVQVFVHRQSPFTASAQLQIFTGDIHDATAVAAAVDGSQAVICTLGSWHTATKDILSAAMQTIIPAMQQQGSQRLISLTGSGAHAPKDTITLSDKLSHAVFGLVAGKIITDAEDHLRQLNQSDLQWTVLRSPVMRDSGPVTYTLNATLPKVWESVSRPAVAQAMVDQLTDQTYWRQAPHLHRNRSV